jgi:hypothetical protein
MLENGLNSISQNCKVNLVIKDTNIIICVGQGVGLCNHILNLGMGWTTPWGFQSSVFVNQIGLEMLKRHHLQHYKTCCVTIHWM